MWELPSDSHAIAIQWVHIVTDPPVTILHVHTVASKYTTLMLLHYLFNYMALRAMCKYSTLLTPSPSRGSLTLWWPYWYRSLVTELSTFPMRTLVSEYGAGVGLISVEPPSLSQGGGAMTELVVADGWVVGDIIDNSESSFVDSINHLFWQSRRDRKSVV